MIRARIVGTGGHLPEKILTNKDIEDRCDTSDEWIRKRTLIEERHIAAEGEAASDLAVPASRMALEEAGILPAEIDVIIFCTITWDYILPATASVLQDKIGATNAAAFDITAACSGFLYGLTTARAFIESGQYKNALVVGAELQSRLLTWKNRDTSVLFADGAGAVVLRPEEGESGLLFTHVGSDGSSRDLLHIPIGGLRRPITPENIHDDPLTIYMKGPELFKRAILEFGKAAQRALDATGLTLADIDLFIPHQANGRIIEAAAQRIGLTKEQVFINIQKVGNTTAASIPIAIHQARTEGRIKEGDTILLAAFGAGLTWGSVMIRW